MEDKKVRDRLIGVATSLIVAAVSFLFYNYFSSFVTLADYNKDKATIVIMANDIAFIKQDVGLIKRKLINH